MEPELHDTDLQLIGEFASGRPGEDEQGLLATNDDAACHPTNDLFNALADEVPVPAPASHPLDPSALGLDGMSEGGEPLAGMAHTVSPQQIVDRERRKRRREAWEEEQHQRRRWELLQKLVDISTEIEILSQEVTHARNNHQVSLPEVCHLPESEQHLLEVSHARRMKDLLQNHCKKTLTTMMQHKWSWPFNTAVDITIYKDYLNKIQTPMDFGTIKQKIDKMQYTHPDGFITDVRLVFDNARIYNQPGSDVHVMANTLQEKFEEKYASSVAIRLAEAEAISLAEQTEARKRHAGLGGPGLHTPQGARIAALVKRSNVIAADIVDAKGAAASLCDPVSRAEKEALCEALGRLPQQQFETAVGLVMHHHPGLQPFDDVAFDLELLDALTLRQMQSYVAACQLTNATNNTNTNTTDGENEEGKNEVIWPNIALGSGVVPQKPKRRIRSSARLPLAPSTDRITDNNTNNNENGDKMKETGGGPDVVVIQQGGSGVIREQDSTPALNLIAPVGASAAPVAPLNPQ